MKTVAKTILLLSTLALAGCATVDTTFREEYRPSRTGNLADGETDGIIAITLHADQTNTTRGRDLQLSMSIRNVGTQPVIFTASPEARLMWVYPDGKRDNMIGSMSEVSGLSGLRLEPGEEVVRHPVVKTYYFNRPGITEFRAVMSAAASDPRGWNGQAISNGLGVRIE